MKPKRLLPLVGAAFFICLVPAVKAATFTVTTTADTVDANPGDSACADSSGNCSLRAAVMEANALGGSHTIVLQMGQTYTLSLDSTAGEEDTGAEDDLDITADIVIQGNGAIIERSTAVTCNLDSTAAAGEFRIFEVSSGASLTLQDLTVQNGCADGPIAPDHQSGGGIWNSGTLTLTNSTISGNSARQSGGGILNGGTATLTNSTISGNSAFLSGGGIRNGGTATITNSTISGNSASSGSGIYNYLFATLNASFVTVANNTGGSGIRNLALAPSVGTINIKNSIVAANPAGNCANDSGATFNSQGGNFASDNSCPGFTQSASLNLGPLANNGGPTQTHALGPGSAAIDAAADCAFVNPPGGTATTDQRGVSRPQGSQCDAGAFEAGADMQANAPSVPPSLGPGGSYSLAFSCTNNGPDAATNATCAVSVSAGAVSGVSCSPSVPVASLASGSTISCTSTFTAPGSQGGGDTPETGVTFTVTAGSATSDSNTTNNTATSGAIPIVDALNDAASFPAGTSGASFNVGSNDQYGSGSLPSSPALAFAVLGGTCSGASINASGVATFNVPAAGTCTVNYQVCVVSGCDTATLTVTAQQVEAIPTLQEWGMVVLTLLVASTAVLVLRRRMVMR
ncbi:MAG: hypothetical protein KatS3mg007_1035 [Thermoanaerobaculum sp.]|nr:MAG: hypothetical protein KatS3mg007_1035 [Thermoanaerobaculum sp.]